MPTKPKNALTHGLYAGDVVLAWENENDFNSLLESLRAEFYPDSAMEEEAVFDLASWTWKKRRLNVGTQLAYHQHPDAGDLADAGRGGWRGVADYLSRTSGDGDRICDTIRATAKSCIATMGKVHALIDEQVELISRATTSPESVGQEGKQADRAELDRLTALAKELNVMNTELIIPSLKLIETYDLDQKISERAYRPEIMERNLKIAGEIDKRIEKTIVRLVNLKEFKKLYGPKEVKASPAEVINLPARRIGPSGKA